MKIGLGLPAIADRAVLLEWAGRADAGSFSTLALLDRLVYDNPEPLVTLSVLAGATERIRLQTEVLLAPLRETPLLAKQAATLDRLSGGRFTLGIGVGGREDDFAVAGVDLATRGRRLDRQMTELFQLWSGKVVGPAPLEGSPEVLFGAFRPAALARVAKFGHGLIAAGAAQWRPRVIETVREQWQAAGRPGQPRIVIQVNATLRTAADEARTNVLAYYGEPYGHQVAAGLLDTPEQLLAAIADAEHAGADELILYNWSTDPNQVTEIAAVIAAG
ncbi:LLM class flavin-dependent oxidoreductase [Fodinicola acaciae]|uniref:LLM class flavin-dependent oxidoreductase n=1 Tax=Fodinicola acaciae TaxID=2681555 RepID=UPI0013D62265|nr:LLM class flavin-dependent oxidoreductase [Fodinicola acaciae]